MLARHPNLRQRFDDINLLRLIHPIRARDQMKEDTNIDIEECSLTKPRNVVDQESNYYRRNGFAISSDGDMTKWLDGPCASFPFSGMYLFRELCFSFVTFFLC